MGQELDIKLRSSRGKSMRETTIIDLDRAYTKKGGLKKFIEISWHQVGSKEQSPSSRF